MRSVVRRWHGETSSSENGVEFCVGDANPVGVMGTEIGSSSMIVYKRDGERERE